MALKKIAAGLLSFFMFLSTAPGIKAADDAVYRFVQTGDQATIINRDKAKVTFDNVIKVKEEDGRITVYALGEIPYQADANSFAVAVSEAGGFNIVAESRYKLYEQKADSSKGRYTGETVDGAELLERGIVAVCNPTTEEKYWEITPNRGNGTLRQLSGNYIVQLSNTAIFSKQAAWGGDAFYIQIVSGPNSSAVAEVVKTIEVEGEGRWEVLSNGKRRFMEYGDGYSGYSADWKKIAGKWYYFYPYTDGVNGLEIYDMATGWAASTPLEVYRRDEYAGNNGFYFFEENGALKTGWVKRDNVWYYLNPDRRYRTGWFRDLEDRYAPYGEVWYFFDEMGKMVTGWVWSNGKWYFLDDSGRMANKGWQGVVPAKEGVVMLGNWEGFRYFDTTGAMAVGWKQINHVWHYFRPDGGLHKNWLHLNGDWYYLRPQGMATGWNKIDGKWYRFDINGRMLRSTVTDGYTLGSDGAWIET